jgi:hypothetical protein
MTDHLHPDDPLDDLASAHLDGLTSPEEAARVERDPELGARVAAFAEARAALRADTGPVDAARRDAAVAAAVAAFDPQAGGATVTPLSAARGRPSPRRLAVLAVAAAVAAIAVLVPVLARQGDDGSTTTAAEAPGTAAKRSADDATENAPMAAPGAGGGNQSQLTVAADAATDLGTFPGVTDLAASVRARLAAAPMSDTAMSTTTVGLPGATTTVPSDAEQACIAQVTDAAAGSGGLVVLSGTAEVDGRSVVAVVSEAPDGARTLHVVDPAAGCAAVDDVTL